MDINFGSNKRERAGRAPKEKKSGSKKRVKLIVISVVLAVVLLLVGAYVALTTVNGNRVSSFTVSSTPNITEYYMGEDLDTTGLSFLVAKFNGTFYHVGVDEVTLRGYDNSKPCDALLVYADYVVDGESFTTSFTVKIKELPQPSKKISGIEYLGPKTSYIKGENFVHQGTLNIIYEDDTRQALTMKYSYVKDTFDTSKVSDGVQVVVKCKLAGKLYTTTFTIVVTEN